MSSALRTSALLLLALGLVVASFPFISKPRVTAHAGSQPLYLPSGAGLEFMTFGYSNALSDALWLHTVSYFGKHYSTDKDYRWLNHMCELVTRLNPRVYEPYHFCSTMLAWELETPAGKRQAVRLLSEGVKAHPDDWFFLYLRGFYSMYFFGDQLSAHKDFESAASLPNAHPIVGRLAAESLLKIDTPEAAIKLLEGIFKTAKDPNQRAAIQGKIDELRRESEGKGS